MTGWRQLVAIAIAIAMIHLGVIDTVWSAVPVTAASPAAVKQQVAQFGLGAKVKVRLASGKKLNGTILAIEDGSFTVGPLSSSGTPVAYDQVAELKLAKNTYKTKGTVDQHEVRRVVVELGVGRHVVVKTVGGDEYHGKIQSIGDESFRLLPDRQRQPTEIGYSEVLQTGPNLSKAAKIAIVAIAVLVIVVVIVGEQMD